MESLPDKRTRLRGELQRAYGAWLTASGNHLGPAPDRQPPAGERAAPPQGHEAEWLAYLAARTRMVAAYAEQATAS